MARKKRGKKRGKKPGGPYFRPRVYIEEVLTGSRPIEGVGTAVAAFIGSARRHPLRAAVAILATAAALAAVLRAIRT